MEKPNPSGLGFAFSVILSAVRDLAGGPLVTAPTKPEPTSPLVGAAICRPPSGLLPTQRQRNSVREPFLSMSQQGRRAELCGGRGPGVGEPGPCSFVYFLQEIHRKIRAWPSPRAQSGAECGNSRLCHPERSEGSFKIPRHYIPRDDRAGLSF